MRKLIAVCFRDPDRSCVATFPDLRECIAFVESIEALRAGAAGNPDYRIETLEWTGRAISKPPTFNAVARPRSPHWNSRQHRRYRLRLLFRQT